MKNDIPMPLGPFVILLQYCYLSNRLLQNWILLCWKGTARGQRLKSGSRYWPVSCSSVTYASDFQDSVWMYFWSSLGRNPIAQSMSVNTCNMLMWRIKNQQIVIIVLLLLFFPLQRDSFLDTSLPVTLLSACVPACKEMTTMSRLLVVELPVDISARA